jgi:hypothetical protein
VASTVDEVYSCALHIVDGPPHLVEEVVLRVYWELARKAPRLGRDVVVATWLRKHTCKAAVKILREADRSADPATLKREAKGLSTPGYTQAAPPGLANRVSHSILLNTARTKSLLFLLPRFYWPDWIRPLHVGAAAACLITIIAVWKFPFHGHNPIVLAPELQITPASFGQLANFAEGFVPSQSHIQNTNVETLVNEYEKSK